MSLAAEDDLVELLLQPYPWKDLFEQWTRYQAELVSLEKRLNGDDLAEEQEAALRERIAQLDDHLTPSVLRQMTQTR